MSFDALCLACMVHELSPLVNGRVQQVLLTGRDAVGMEIYAGGERRYLQIVATPEASHLYLASGKLRRGEARETPLLLLLRKYVRDALLAEAMLPVAAERLLRLTFRHRQHGVSRLHVELLGRAANLILTRENGTILGGLARVTGEVGGGRRVLLPGRRYELPPPSARLSPLLPPAELAVALAPHLAAGGPVWKTVLSQVAGVGPEQAREIQRRALLLDGSAAAVAAALGELWAPLATGEWQPHLWLREGRPSGFSPWRPAPGPDAPDALPRPSLSAALEEATVVREASDATPTTAPRDEYAVARAAVSRSLAAARNRIARALAALAGDEPPPGAAETLRHHAEWLLALASTLAPGATELTLTPEESGGPALHIPLDPALTPVEQAQRLFKRAARAKRAAAFVPTRRARLHNDLAYLDDLAADLSQAQNQPEIAAVSLALADAGLAPHKASGSPTRPGALSGPRRYGAPDGSRIFVGRNARQNDHLTFDVAAPSDLWLHVRGAPGAHVVLLSDGRPPSEPAVERAAQLAGHFSSLRGERAVDVIVVERRHVHRAPGGHPGQVTVRHERVLRVVPAELDT